MSCIMTIPLALAPSYRSMPICSACGANAPSFSPLSAEYRQSVLHCQYSLDAFETLHLPQYACPTCGASDRDRLMALYFLRQWVEGGRAQRARVLEIAPSPALSGLLREFAGEYRSADLVSTLAMDQVDVTDMCLYTDGRFDLVFCSHVLEHVVDDASAMREIARVLAPGGAAALLVPIPFGLEKTDEVLPDETLPSVLDRVRRFGQEDHVRMYARQDFIERIRHASLEVEPLTQGSLPDDDFADFGLAPTSCLYVARKP